MMNDYLFIFYVAFVVSCLVNLVFLMMIIRRFYFAHELGHAKEAVRKGVEVFILLPFCLKTKAAGVKVYCVKKKDFYEIYKNKWAGGVAIYKEPDNFLAEDALEITQGGPEGGKRFLLKKRFQIPLYLVNVVITVAMVNGLFYESKGVENAVLLGTVIVSALAQILIMTFALELSKGINAKRQLMKMEAQLNNCKQNGTYNVGVCDRAKIKYQDRYLMCRQIIKEKNLHSECEYEKVIEKLFEMGYIQEK